MKKFQNGAEVGAEVVMQMLQTTRVPINAVKDISKNAVLHVSKLSQRFVRPFH